MDDVFEQLARNVSIGHIFDSGKIYSPAAAGEILVAPCDSAGMPIIHKDIVPPKSLMRNIQFRHEMKKNPESKSRFTAQINRFPKHVVGSSFLPKKQHALCYKMLAKNCTLVNSAQVIETSQVTGSAPTFF